MTGERARESCGASGPDVRTGELPRFIELLRLSHGPIPEGFEHCGEPPEIDEVEELAGEDQFDPEKPIRGIYTCTRCGRHFWGWWA